MPPWQIAVGLVVAAVPLALIIGSRAPTRPAAPQPAATTQLSLARPAPRPLTHTPAPIRTVLREETIGYSVQRRPIVAYELGDPQAGTTAVLLGQMHGDEPIGVAIAGAVVSGRPVHGIHLWVIPTMNPDGSAAHTRQNAERVDLNRNWPHAWAHLTGEYYSGPAPLSEPETRAMAAFLNRVRPDLMISIHQPLDGVDTTDGGARDPAFRHRLAALLHLPEKALTCWDVCRGSMTGWLTATQPGAAITVEYPAEPPGPAAAAASAMITALGGRV